MLTLKFGGDDFRRNIAARAAKMRVRYERVFEEVVAHVWNSSVQSAPIRNGQLRRSAYADYSGTTQNVMKAAVVFPAPYAMLVHENYSGVTISPTHGYLYVPLTKKGERAGQTRDYSGIKMFRDYVLPGFPGKPKSVRIPPQKYAGFLYRHAKVFWVLFRRLLEAA